MDHTNEDDTDKAALNESVNLKEAVTEHSFILSSSESDVKSTSSCRPDKKLKKELYSRNKNILCSSKSDDESSSEIITKKKKSAFKY